MTEQVEHGPAVDLFVGGDVLRQFEREATDEHAEPAEHRLLVRRQQAVAPFERRAQRLVAPQQRARAAGQQVEALVEPRTQPFDAKQPHAGGRQLDRQWYAVEAAADVCNRQQIWRT